MTITGAQLNTLFLAFVLTWFAGIVLLGVRATRSGRAYLRRFPSASGVRVESYVDQRWPGKSSAVRRAYREAQSDPELEALRQAARRSGRLVLAWIFGYPIVLWGTLALLIVLGYVHA